MNIIFAYITIEKKEQAKELVRKMLNNKIIACANIFPINSMYFWNGKLEDTNEHVIIAKTISDKWEKLKEFVKKNHTYEIPCIVKINATANQEFKNWMDRELLGEK